MKWIGQHIYDLISRFRNDVYLEDLATTTETNVLVVDSLGKVSKSTSVGGDVTSVVAGAGMTGGGTTGDVTLNVIAGTGIDVAADAISVDVSDFMTNGVDNRILTATGADGINAEDHLLFQDTATGTMLSLNAATTTGKAFNISSSALTYGSLLNLDVNNSDVPLSFSELISVDYDKTHVLGTGEAAIIWGLNIDLQNSVNDTGSANVTMTGARIVVDSTGNGGILRQQGIVMEVAKDGNMDNTGNTSGYHTAGMLMTVGNGAPDIVMHSSVDAGDYCRIETGAAGLTKITTNDNAGSDADLELIVDGDIKLSPTAGKAVEIDTSVIIDGPVLKITDTTDTADYFQISTGANGATNITTVDGGAHAADLTFNIDGNFWVNEADQVVLTTPGDIFTESTSFTSIIDDTFDIRSTTAQKPILSISSMSNNRFAGRLVFDKRKYPGTTDDGDFLGDIDFDGRATNDPNEEITFANIKATIQESDDGDEQGQLTLSVANNALLVTGLSLAGNKTTAAQVDVNIAAGAASVTTVAGTLTMGSTAFVNNEGVVQVATQGTIDHDSLANFVTAEHVDWAGASAGTIHSTNIPTLNQNTTGTAATVTGAAQTNITSLGTLTGLTTSGAIELGHATDTTLARSAAGVVTIQGDQIVTAGVNKGKQVHINLRNNQNYLFYINTKSYWYSTSGYTYTYNLSATAADFSMTYLRRARHAAYVAPYACKVKKIYLTAHYTTSYTTADLDFEWAMHKFTPGNNSNSSTTATLMTITDRDGNLAENKNHTIAWDVTDNAASTLAPGDAFGFAARCPGAVDSSAQRQLWYGEAVAVIELI